MTYDMARNFPERSAVDRVGHAVLQRLVPPLDVVQAVDHQVLGRPRGSQVLESHERVRNPMIFLQFSAKMRLLDDVPLLRLRRKLLPPAF